MCRSKNVVLHSVSVLAEQASLALSNVADLALRGTMRIMLYCAADLSGAQYNSKVAFVKHHKDKYEGQFPIWVAMELFTFGMLSYFYNDLKTADKKAFARELGVNYRKLEGWLRCCIDRRNICAHYGRLCHRIFTAAPARLDLAEQDSRRLWGAVFVVRDIYPSSDRWNSEVIPKFEALLDEYKDDIDLRHIAFPEDWKDQLSR